METSPPADRYDRANQLFADCLEKVESERTAFLARQCGSDTELYASVVRLLSRYGKLSDFLEAPPAIATSERGLQPGEVLNERFRIVRVLGHGGMGEVYLADDLALGESVAIKTLQPRLRGNESVAARFRDEIRLARKISHPNICRIFDLFSESRGGRSILYFTMEFLDGPTLARKIAEGPLSPEEALPILRQVAAGLDAAHAAVILHRDLKPSNIALVRTESGATRAIITDFGLAKAFTKLATASGQTAEGQIVGTTEYMAPEQFLGDEPSPATDVFALGCVVYETLSGKHPFPANNVVRSAIRRVLGQPEPISSVAPTMPRKWDAVIGRALAPDPAKRFPTAGALVAELERTAARSGLAPICTRRNAIWAGAAVIAAGTGVFLRFYHWKPVIPADPTMLLMPVRFTPEPGQDPTMGRALDDMLRRQLQQSAGLRLLGDAQVQLAWSRISGKSAALPANLDGKSLRHLGLRAGGNCVVSGNLFRSSDQWVLRMEWNSLGPDPSDSAGSASMEFAARSESDLPAVVYRAASWLRSSMRDASLQSRSHDRLPADLTTSDWNALREFTLAGDASRAHDHEAAISHLKAALAIDPEFAMAASRLGDLLMSRGHHDDALGYQSKAADVIRRKDLTDRESLAIAGMFALDSGQFDEAERIYTRFSVAYPADASPYFYRAHAVESLGRPAEALELARRAAALAPASSAMALRLGYSLMEAGRRAEAERQRVLAAQISPDGAVNQFAAALSFDQLEIPACRESLQKLGQSRQAEDRSKSLAMLACLVAEEGRWEEAERLLVEGVTFDAAQGMGKHAVVDKKRLLAQASLRCERRATAIQWCRDALDMEPDHGDRMHLGCLLAQAGDLRGAAKCQLQRLPDWPCYGHWIAQLSAELALAKGEASRALAILQAAPPPLYFNEWPERLVRATLAAGDRKSARRHVQSLVERPGRFFYQIDVTGIGFMTWAAWLAAEVHLPEASAHKADALRRALIANRY
jgi:tetratricopeptide (TPR) repeat protein